MKSPILSALLKIAINLVVNWIFPTVNYSMAASECFQVKANQPKQQWAVFPRGASHWASYLQRPYVPLSHNGADRADGTGHLLPLNADFRGGRKLDSEHRDLSEQLADIACSVLVLFGSHRGIESIHLVFWPASTLMQSVFMKITSLSHIQRSYDLNVVFSGNIMTMLLKYICSDIPSSLNI